jgi:predicted RNA-binding protein with PIN domain
MNEEEYEKHLRDSLAVLHSQYSKAAEPFINRLVELYSQRVPPITVTTEDAIMAGLLPQAPDAS